MRIWEYLPCGFDDNLSPHGRHANLNSGITILSELTLKDFVELGIEDSVRDELFGFVFLGLEEKSLVLQAPKTHPCEEPQRRQISTIYA